MFDNKQLWNVALRICIGAVFACMLTGFGYWLGRGAHVYSITDDGHIVATYRLAPNGVGVIFIMDPDAIVVLPAGKLRELLREGSGDGTP